MAHILIFITGISAIEGSTDNYIGGDCRTSDMLPDNPSIYWSARIKMDDLLTNINDVIQAAATDAVTREGRKVELLDLKTIVGGMVRL